MEKMKKEKKMETSMTIWMTCIILVVVGILAVGFILTKAYIDTELEKLEQEQKTQQKQIGNLIGDVYKLQTDMGYEYPELEPGTIYGYIISPQSPDVSVWEQLNLLLNHLSLEVQPEKKQEKKYPAKIVKKK